METVIYAFNRESIRANAFTVGPLCNEAIVIFNYDIFITLTQSLPHQHEKSGQRRRSTSPRSHIRPANRSHPHSDF